MRLTTPARARTATFLRRVLMLLPLLAARPSGVCAQDASRVPASFYAGDSTCAGVPPIQVHRFTADFYILRQAACTNFEKPFLYLIFGERRVLLLDSGAGHVDVRTPVDTLIAQWLTRTGRASIELIVAHSHGHGDHVAGDSQFVSRPQTTVVGRDTAAVRTFFGIAQWPADTATYDLGGRVLDVLPIPGHQPASIAVYDRRTGVLLSGDTFYPGRLYVRDTVAFARSTARLVAFSARHRVTHFLGAHIENTRTPGVDYPEGTVNQPAEHGLDLSRRQLLELDSLVQAMRGRFVRTIRPDFTIWPLTPQP
jgi:hydroxyacylglutathione hydrolase